MRKSVLSPRELNELLLAELRRVPGCEGVVWVGVYVLRRHVRGRNWLAAFFNPGTADKQACARAMPAIEARLQLQYDVIEPRQRPPRVPRFLGYRHFHRREPSRLVNDSFPRPRGASAIFANLSTMRKLLTPFPKTGRDRALLTKISRR
jgi:hypothetical protein